MVEAGKSILIVDDDTGILRVWNVFSHGRVILWKLLKPGKEAKQKLKSRLYDIGLFDLRLPDMDGTDLLQMDSRSPKMVKIILTGLAGVSNTFESEEGGADAFLCKPVDPVLLLNTIEMKLKSKA